MRFTREIELLENFVEFDNKKVKLINIIF